MQQLARQHLEARAAQFSGISMIYFGLLKSTRIIGNRALCNSLNRPVHAAPFKRLR